jgi:glycosyltransferase involved in cell wall biosynthesis
LLSVVAAIRVLRRVGGNVLEVMSPSAMVPRALLVQWLSGCRLTTQVRGNVDLLTHSLGAYFYCRIRSTWLIPQLFAGAVHTLIIEAFYRRCTLVVGYNLNNLQSAISNGADPSRSRLARIAIDRAILEAPLVSRDALEGFPKTGRVILLWSRLGPEKYVSEALEAFIDLAATHSDVSLVTIGDGPTRAALESRAQAAGLGDRALFLGYRDHGFIRSAGACADVALVPYGGSSLVEAVLLDLPVVAFDVEWHAELIRNGETGFLADFRDPRHLATQLRAALDGPDQARQMARACRAVADRMFDPMQVRADEHRFYETLLRHSAA